MFYIFMFFDPKEESFQFFNRGLQSQNRNKLSERPVNRIVELPRYRHLSCQFWILFCNMKKLILKTKSNNQKCFLNPFFLLRNKIQKSISYLKIDKNLLCAKVCFIKLKCWDQTEHSKVQLKHMSRTSSCHFI